MNGYFLGKYLCFICLYMLCALSSVAALQQRRLAVLQPMSAVGYRPFTTESHEWYLSSPNGRRLAYLASVKGGQVLLVDGIPSPKYDEIYWFTISFAPSGDRVIYSAKRDGQVRLVVDGHEGPSFAWIDLPIFSPDSAHMAYLAESAGRQYQVVSDGKVGPTFSTIWGLHYASDGQLCYTAQLKEKECYASINGRQHGPYMEISGDIVCSLDGKHVVYWVSHSSDQLQRTIVYDGVEGATYAGDIEWFTFSPDSQHLAYIANHDGKRRLLLEGKEIAAYPDNSDISPPLFSPDSAHLVCKVRLDNKERLLLDGKEVARAVNIADVQYCGNRLAYRLVEAKRERVVIGDTMYPWRTISTILLRDVYDPWMACYMGRWRMFHGGTEGEPDNFSRGLSCTADGKHWAYPVRVGTQQAMLSDNHLGVQFPVIGIPFFSPNGQRLAYPIFDGKSYAMLVDGQRGTRYLALGSPAFSSDSRLLAYPAYSKQGATVIIDGRAGAEFSEILGKGNLWNGQQVTFDSPARLHYLARRGLGLYYVREYLLPAASPDTFTYFENGYTAVSRSRLKQMEQQAAQGGHMPWRKDILSVAQVMSMSLLPTIPSGKMPAIHETPAGDNHDIHVASGRWEAVFRKVSATATRAHVEVFVNGRRWYRLTLERPFGYWWYLTGIVTIP